MILSRRNFIFTAGCVAGGALAKPATGSAGVAEAPTLTLTGADYVRLMAIATGDVRPEKVRLTWVRGDRNEMLRRATDAPNVDGGESSMAQHVMRLDRGDRSLVAIPIFPLRNFTARDLYMRKGASLTAGSLGGRRIGIYSWGASGAVWYRHFLRYLGHDTTKVIWIVGGTDEPAAVVMPDPPLPNVSAAPTGSSLSDLLLADKIDAVYSPLPPQKFDAGRGPIVRVFPDFRTVEQKYYAETRCFPPQHVILLRRQSWDRDPSVARRLVDAFDKAETAFEAGQRYFPYNSPWQIETVEEALRVMGADCYAHGLEKNRHVVDTFCQGAFQDGLTKRALRTDDFFADFLKAL
jgi:4,5-dihydroxyphthalate decarboxylase